MEKGNNQRFKEATTLQTKPLVPTWKGLSTWWMKLPKLALTTWKCSCLPVMVAEKLPVRQQIRDRSNTSGWWFQTFLFSIIYWEYLGMSSSQLTFHIFQRGWNHQPDIDSPSASLRQLPNVQQTSSALSSQAAEQRSAELQSDTWVFGWHECATVLAIYQL